MSTTTRNLLPGLLLGLALMLLPAPARPDGFIIPDPIPGLPRPVSLTVQYHHVDVAVRNGACYKCLNCGESLGCS